MNRSEDDRAAFAKALDWASRITTLSIMMVLPALLGYWLDQRFGTVILCTFFGLVLGVAMGIWQLVKLVSMQDDGGNDEEPPRTVA